MDEDPETDIPQSDFVYPRIENIYSDVVNIKTEPVDSEDNDFQSIELAEYGTSTSNNYYSRLSNNIIVSSNPSRRASMDSAPETSTASQNWEEQDTFHCDKCNIIFPTHQELDSHEMASHSFLVARPIKREQKSVSKSSIEDAEESSNSSQSSEDVSSEQRPTSRQNAASSTSDAALNKSYPLLYKAIKGTSINQSDDRKSLSVLGSDAADAESVDKLLCKHCDVRFPNEIALIKHTYELIPENKLKFKCNICDQGIPTRTQLTLHMIHDHGEQNTKFLQCTYCTCYLRHANALKRHVLLNHKTTNCVLKYVKFTGKCALCQRTAMCNTQYNNHISKVHRKIYHRSHKTLKHPAHAQKNMLVAIREKPDPKVLSTNIQKLKSKSLVSKSSTNLTVGGAPIPKQTLFKCSKCQIHFVTCWSAFDHSKRCVLAKGDWKCNKCRRSFTHLEEPIHTLQHEFSDKFKVHTVNDNIVSRVLCRCPKCELHFEERSFWRHVSSGCSSESGVDCSVCDLRIHANSCTAHKKTHAMYNYTRADFIVIEFVDVSFQDDGSSKETTSQVANEKQKEKRILFFCVNCKTHMTKVRDDGVHKSGDCQRFSKRFCHFCGLLFHYKNIKRHVILNHNFLNLKLTDFTFIRLQDRKVINPAIPDFIKCDKCKVRFVNKLHVKEHQCGSQNFTKCSICSRKYDSVTYSLHLHFHEYCRSSNTERRSCSVPKLQIFFSCVSCSYGFNNYDSLVEHCQKHYTSSESLTTSECKICNLSYAYGHKNSHSGGALFKILKFHYENLLSDIWLKGFNSVSQGEIKEILSKSVYGATRSVRLMLSIDGPPERSLYKCAKCELCFEPGSIAEHTKGQCKKAQHYKCTSCAAAFPTPAFQTKHIDLHVVYGDDIVFREIVFNDASDRHMNDALRASVKESLKFRKCQQCELFIKKNEYQEHIESHEKSSAENVKSKSGKKVEFRFLKPADTTKRMFTVYQCHNCKACIINKFNIRRHGCQPDVSEHCSKCSLWYRSCFQKRHNYLHAAHPKFLKSNITIVEFELNPKGNAVPKKRRRYSSDDDASTGSLPLHNTVRKTYATRKSHAEKTYSNYLTESENSQDSYSNSIKKFVTKVELETSQSTADRAKGKSRSKLYQCELCHLIFMQMEQLLIHRSKCDPDNLTVTPFDCEMCDIKYHPSLTMLHEELHETINKNPKENFVYLINISVQGRDPSDIRNWLYKCKLCDVNYLSFRALEFHFNKNHKSVQDFVFCDICGLKFTTHSRSTHLSLQHRKPDGPVISLNIAVAEKKIVKTRELTLPMSSNEHCNDVEVEESIDEINNDLSQDINAETDNDVPITNRDISTVNVYNKTTDTAIEGVGGNVKLSGNYVEVVQMKKQSKRGPRAIDDTLYKCDVCFIHFINKDTLIAHVKLKTHFTESAQCDVCGLAFTTRTIKKHKFVQHKLLNFSLKDFVISTLTGEQVVNEDANAVAACNEKCTSDIVAELNAKEEKENTGLSVATNTGANEDADVNNNLYKCAECFIHYINKSTLLGHVAMDKHGPTGASNCDTCGLMFENCYLLNHKRLQHEQLKLSREDFIITDISGPEVHADHQSNVKYASSIDTDDMPLIKLENKSVLKEKEKMFRLYQCKDCRVCVQKTQRKLHVCCSDIQKKHCIKCSLSFSRIDIGHHRELHKKYLNLSRKNFLLTKFGHRATRNNRIYKCVVCSTHFVNLNALEWHMDAWNHQTKRVECEICGLCFGKFSLSRHVYMHHTKLNLTIEQFNIVCVSTADKDISSKEIASPNLINSLDPTASDHNLFVANSKVTKKLFKCFECDVHFLTQTSYYQHMYKHASLDLTEFIACKICDLQFLTEDLGEHMKSHRDKSFSLDKLLIQGYQPNTNELVESYFTADSDNSKLVSTTTPFDNDDETVSGNSGEQLSTVDSTSDEISKTYVQHK